MEGKALGGQDLTQGNVYFFLITLVLGAVGCHYERRPGSSVALLRDISVALGLAGT